MCVTRALNVDGGALYLNTLFLSILFFWRYSAAGKFEKLSSFLSMFFEIIVPFNLFFLEVTAAGKFEKKFQIFPS